MIRQEFFVPSDPRGVIRNHCADYFKSGTVVIGIIDNKTGKIICRDYATRDVTGVLSDAQLKAHASSAVQQALAKSEAAKTENLLIWC